VVDTESGELGDERDHIFKHRVERLHVPNYTFSVALVRLLFLQACDLRGLGFRRNDITDVGIESMDQILTAKFLPECFLVEARNVPEALLHLSSELGVNRLTPSLDKFICRQNLIVNKLLHCLNVLRGLVKVALNRVEGPLKSFDFQVTFQRYRLLVQFCLERSLLKVLVKLLQNTAVLPHLSSKALDCRLKFGNRRNDFPVKRLVIVIKCKTTQLVRHCFEVILISLTVNFLPEKLRLSFLLLDAS